MYGEFKKAVVDGRKCYRCGKISQTVPNKTDGKLVIKIVKVV